MDFGTQTQNWFFSGHLATGRSTIIVIDFNNRSMIIVDKQKTPALYYSILATPSVGHKLNELGLKLVALFTY